MKFTNVFRDVLKDEDWVDSKKSWSYPLLKTNLVNIKSLESGGATISTANYSIDNAAGIIQWNGEGQPTDITLVADCPNAFLGMLRKYLLYSIGSFILIGGLMFWAGSFFTPPEGGTSEETAQIIDSLSKKIDTLSTTIINLENMLEGSDAADVIELRNMITDLQNQKKALATTKDSTIQVLKTSLADSNQATSSCITRRNHLQSQLASKNTELAACKTTTTTTTSRGQYSGYKATYLCRRNSTKFPEIVQAGIILKGAGISLKYSTFDSPVSDVKKIIYKKNDKAFAEYVLKKIKKLGIVANIEEENGSNIPNKTVFICID